MSENVEIQDDNSSFEVSVQGSLGLLAYGDIGLRAWRKVKKEDSKKSDLNEKK
jgi:hypothetical protein